MPASPRPVHAEKPMSKLVLVAVGGNALIRSGQKGTAQEQFENAVETAAAVVRLIRAGHRVVLTHGNGPQVGAQLVRSELAAAHAYRLPLDCCVASTQGEVGYVLQYAMWQMMQAEGLNTPVVSLITQVLVDSAGSRLPAPDETYRAFLHQRSRRALSRSARLGDCRGSDARIPQSGPFSGADRHRRARCD